MLFAWGAGFVASASAQAHGLRLARGGRGDRLVRRVFFVVFNLDYLLGGDGASSASGGGDADAPAPGGDDPGERPGAPKPADAP